MAKKELLHSKSWYTMLSKKEIAFIRSLSKSSSRKKEKKFIAEGFKSIIDLMPYFDCYCIVANEYYKDKLVKSSISTDRLHIVGDDFDFGKISGMKSSQGILAVFHCKEMKKNPSLNKNQVYLFLDDIQDPGNLGTIIRTSDWFGIDTLFITKGCVDMYNNKVVQSTMGSLGRINIFEIDDVKSFFLSVDANILGTFIDNSEDINKISITYDRPTIVVVGNEGNGISNEVARFVTKRITIPMAQTRKDKKTPDSLNVSIATAITLFKLSSLR